MSEISVLNGYKIKDKKAIRFYDNVESMKADTTLKSGMLVETKGYYEPNDGGSAKYHIVSESNKYYELLTNELKAELIIDKELNVKQFGAYGDNEHDDIIFIKNAINNTLKRELYFPNGTYKISETLEFPENTIINCNNTVLVPTFNEGDVISCNKPGYTTGNQPSYHIKGKLRINGTSEENNLVGLHLGASKNSSFENITITETRNAGIKLESTYSGDIDNPTFSHCHCYNTGGVVIKSGSNEIQNGSITDGAFRDCIIDCAREISAINILKESNKSIFGIKFDRCFINSSNYPVITILKDSNSTGFIDYLKFDECTVEIKNSINNPYYAIIDSVTNSHFDLKGQLINTSGYKITNSRNCKFERISYDGYQNTDKIIDIDENSENISFSNFSIPKITYYHEGNYNSVLKNDLCNMIIDKGTNNKIFNSAPFENIVTSLNNKNNLLSLASDTIKSGYALRFSTATVENNQLKLTLQANQNSPRITLPIRSNKKYTGIHVRYKLLNDFVPSGSAKLRMIPYNTFTIQLDTTKDKWIDTMFIIPSKDADSYFGIDGIITSELNILIDKLEFIDGSYLPYFNNYNIIEGNQ